ncbi:unnamed protein product [Didymodactylos carnosus]|uniref:Uncharacterized protein n=1 Tax=Didymodactylos carnosus TaxID=1234261 RepID=A0A813QX18_9BILA|nr:unnamed protein product [Didymodactylos carnosus]CAF0774919.1 unnamed protein product [Didymodactylos carnosus]CAF3505782.1 unnamed protein product [Didymodactylos carnosus]CAF3557405.1 unnamed protein product [Didymodactylos carnosus]
MANVGRTLSLFRLSSRGSIYVPRFYAGSTTSGASTTGGSTASKQTSSTIGSKSTSGSPPSDLPSSSRTGDGTNPIKQTETTKSGRDHGTIPDPLKDRTTGSKSTSGQSPDAATGSSLTLKLLGAAAVAAVAYFGYTKFMTDPKVKENLEYAKHKASEKVDQVHDKVNQAQDKVNQKIDQAKHEIEKRK